MGLSTVVAASMMSFSAVSAQADWATGTPGGGGEIGLVDTDTTTVPAPTLAIPNPTAADNGTQIATMVIPGVNGQKLSDVRLLLPNTFKNGDTIDLAIFDRTATSSDNGQINADSNHKLGFGAAPTVSVNPTPFAGKTAVTTTPATVPTHIGPLSSSPGNTEGTAVNLNAATPYVATVTPTSVKPTTPPAFTTTLVESSRAHNLATDIIRLTVNNVQSAGDANADWIVTLSGLKADLGPSVSPGELRVVPFAYNGAPSTTISNQSKLFGGNVAGDPTAATPVPQVVNTYTVPAYVSPVDFQIAAPTGVVADGTNQLIGDIKIAETNAFSLQPGTYSITVGGSSAVALRRAIVANNSTNLISVKLTNPANGETLGSPTATVSGNVVSFTLNQTDATAANSGKVSVTLSGLLLNSGLTKGTVTYTLSGGSVSGSTASFMSSPAGSSTLTIPNPSAPPANVIAADTAFSAGVNQKDIEAPKLPVVNAISTPIAFRIGGIDRYDTAAKIALYNGQNEVAVLASGMDFPDALSSGYLASQFGASILLTKQNSLPASTLQALRENGVLTVYVIGGTGAISAGVEAQLRATPQYYGGGEITVGAGKLQVVRLGGADRYATNKVVNIRAAALKQGANPVGRTTIKYGQASKLTALVATGQDFADAMSGGPATAGVFGFGHLGSLPLILTKTGSLSTDASDQITGLGIQQAVILGGAAAVSTGVESSISGLGVAIKRIGGSDRYETATMIADFEITSNVPTLTTDGGLGFSNREGNSRIFLATGQVYADALAGAPLAGSQGSPIVLTKSTTLPTFTQTWLSGHAALYSNVTALGLGGAVSQSVLDAANLAIAGN